MRTKTIPATSFASLFPFTFAFGAATVREVAASGGSTEDHASIKAARTLRRGKECSPSFQIKKNADEIDYGILKTCLKEKDCIEDITSSLGGRCVASEMSSESIRSLSHESIKIQNGASFVSTSCVYANGTYGVKCVGGNACSGADIATIGCGSCIGYYACRNMNDTNIIAENSCLGDNACFDMGVNNTISENSCLGGYACAFTNDNSTIGKNSCIGSNACFETEGKSLPR